MIAKSTRCRPRRAARRRASAFVLIARAPDGRVRAERFSDLASYRARLARLERSDEQGLSVDEIAGLLDA